MTRNGKTLKTLQDGAQRRMSDGRNAWRKMSAEQRLAFVEFIAPDLASDKALAEQLKKATRGLIKAG